jgi:hypothetical protein
MRVVVTYDAAANAESFDLAKSEESTASSSPGPSTRPAR